MQAVPVGRFSTRFPDPKFACFPDAAADDVDARGHADHATRLRFLCRQLVKDVVAKIAGAAQAQGGNSARHLERRFGNLIEGREPSGKSGR